jgi:hypothetical protein
MSAEAQNVLNTVSLKDIPSILHLLQESEQAKLLEDLKLLENMKNKELAQTKFMAFVRQMWPAFISGKHHAIMAEAFERVASGECKRLIINMPPPPYQVGVCVLAAPVVVFRQVPAQKSHPNVQYG